MAGDKTFLDDAASLKALVQMLPVHERSVYSSYGSLALESAFPNRLMVVYTLKGGQPTDIVLCRFGDITIDRIRGPSFTLVMDGPDRREYSIGPVPFHIPGRDLFMHVPQNFVLKWKGKAVAKRGDSEVHFVPHYAVLIKSRSKETHQIEGDTYMVRLNLFRERFPETELRY